MKEAMQDPEEAAKKFRMIALMVFALFLILVYFLFDYVA